MGFGLDIGFIDHMYTPPRTTSNYSAIDNLHNSQITTAPAKPFPVCWCLTSCSLTASNSGDSSASSGQILLSQPPMQNSCQFPQSQLTAMNSRTLNPNLCCNCQLSHCYLFLVMELPSQETLSIIVPSLLSLPCTAQLNCQPSTLSLNYYQRTWGRRYIASGRTQEKTPFLKIPLLLLAYSLPSNECLLSLHCSGLQASCHNMKEGYRSLFMVLLYNLF
jgi:hypothetical protein